MITAGNNRRRRWRCWWGWRWPQPPYPLRAQQACEPLFNTFIPEFQKYILPTPFERSGNIIIFHLSKWWKAKFFLLCYVIFLVRLQAKFEIWNHSWEWKFSKKSHAVHIMVRLSSSRSLIFKHRFGKNTTVSPSSAAVSLLPRHSRPLQLLWVKKTTFVNLTHDDDHNLQKVVSLLSPIAFERLGSLRSSSLTLVVSVQNN